MRYYCTFFDRNSLVKALAMLRSLGKHEPQAYRVYVVCLDELTRVLLDKMSLPNIELIPLQEVEAHDEALSKTRRTRELIEFYWTLTPSVINKVMDSRPEIDVMTYLDPDLFFYSSPTPIHREFGDASILIHGHRFSPSLKTRESDGKYSIGLLGFRRDTRGMTALKWWRDRCNEWCFKREEKGIMGDQIFLDDWPTRFEGVHILEHVGAGLAPWNHDRYMFRGKPPACIVNGHPLVLYHFHALAFAAPQVIIPSKHAHYSITEDILRCCYLPYVSELSKAISAIRAVNPTFDFGLAGPIDENVVFMVQKSAWLQINSAVPGHMHLDLDKEWRCYWLPNGRQTVQLSQGMSRSCSVPPGLADSLSGDANTPNEMSPEGPSVARKWNLVRTGTVTAMSPKIMQQRVLVFSFEHPESACATIRLKGPFHRLHNEFELKWAVRLHEGRFSMDASDIDDADLIVFQRLFPRTETSPIIEKVLRSGKPVIYETDDFLVGMPFSNPHKGEGDVCSPFIRELIERADAVTVSTAELGRRLGVPLDRLHVLPNLLPDIFLAEVPSIGSGLDSGRDRPVIIGYSGTATHQEDLVLVEDALARIVDMHPGKVQFRFMGYATDKMHSLPGVTFVPFSVGYEMYARTLRSSGIDIAVVPLADNHFNRCKSNIKWLEYSASNIPGIFSDLPPYRNSVSHGETGVLVSHQTDDWVLALDRLIRNPVERTRIANAARAEVENKYTLAAQGTWYFDAYRQILGRHPRSTRVGGCDLIPSVPSPESTDPAALERPPRSAGAEGDAGDRSARSSHENSSTPGGGQAIPVSVVIPVFNKVEYTRKCVEALASTTGMEETAEIVILDNGSTDGTREFLASLGGDVVIVRNTKNLGFAAACNQGARVSRGRDIVFLNNDTVPQSGWLQALLAAARKEDAAIYGARLLYPDGRIQHAGVAFNSTGIGYHIFNGFPKDHPAVTKRRRFQAVTAACMLVRRDVFEALGGFDEGYRNGFEDVDFCLRAEEKGYRILYVPDCVVIHHEETTEGRKAHDRENLDRFLARWRGKVEPDDDRIYAEEGFRKIVCPDGSRITIEPVAGQTGISSAGGRAQGSGGMRGMRVEEHRPDAEDIVSRGRALKKEKRYVEAMESFLQARSDGDVSVLADIGDCFAQEGKLKEAASAYREAIIENPRDSRILAGLGVLDCLIVARKVDSEARGRERRVSAALESGNLESARSMLEEYLEAHPLDADALLRHSDICFRLGRVEEALTNLDKILLFYPGRKDALVLKAEVERALPTEG